MRDVPELEEIARRTFATHGLSDPEKVVVARALLGLTHYGRKAAGDKKNGEKSPDSPIIHKFRWKTEVCNHAVEFEWLADESELRPGVKYDLFETSRMEAMSGICNDQTGGSLKYLQVFPNGVDREIVGRWEIVR